MGPSLQLWKQSLGHSGFTAWGALLTPLCEMEYRKTAADCPAGMAGSSRVFSQSGCLVLAFTLECFHSRVEQSPVFKWSPSLELLVIGIFSV